MFVLVFIVYRTVSYVFERLFRHSGTGPNIFKIIGVYVSIKAISSDRLYLRQIATAAFNLGTWNNDT